MDIDDVVRENKQKGNHFFDDDTMEHFNSRVETNLFYDKYFVTSEKAPHEKQRFFTVRRVTDDFDVRTVGEFQAYDTKSEAIDRVEQLAGE